ncbi:8-oxo-dGDP phosphatase NUDT18-like [Hydractinia symbiolongicarpus]|uniref:8-oxo-dGDP phosphatase NUDT18-like n=1 Tax=Hydractinia symbiolongicarpus TaxID=13093 RepID=UPI00254E3402|nr:8-oxo-dGDP phosphatase NUDT18-like [Hydractinia symbiolongicarpus]
MSDFVQGILKLQTGSVNFESKLQDHPPCVHGENLIYIVSAILIKEEKILLVSENRPECYGAWYLPAGKVEKNETLESAFERELVEESFIQGKADHLLSIDHDLFGRWFRYNFIGHSVGGRLKTLEDQDKESLEAKWFPISDVLNGALDLRCSDILHVIKDAVNWLSADKSIQHIKSLPIQAPYTHHIQRLIIIDARQRDNIRLALVKTLNILPWEGLTQRVEASLNGVFTSKTFRLKRLGMLSIEHLPNKNKPSDGVCFNILFRVEEGEEKESFDWIVLDENLKIIFEQICASNSFIIF